MLTAIRNSDKEKVIGDEIEKDEFETYECDFCNNLVIHNKSETKIKIGHFKHRSGQSFCPNNTNESEWHIKTKLDIVKYVKSSWQKNLKNIGVEVWLANKSIRADIYFETLRGNKIAIEVQASILQVSEIKKRTEKYNTEGIYVMWIIPYEHLRFNELKRKRGFNNQKWEVLEEYWGYVESIRLKEYEIFLYWCYFKKIFAWDLTHEYSDDFIVIELDEYITQVSTFYQDGEEKTVGGNKTKTTKIVKSVRRKVSFDKLTISNVKAFEVKNRAYTIPERKIFTINDRNKN